MRGNLKFLTFFAKKFSVFILRGDEIVKNKKRCCKTFWAMIL